MLDWAGVGVNALWVVGAALALAAISYADWWAHSHQVHRRLAWSTPAFLSSFFMGLALVGLSLFLQAHSPWERVLWGTWSLLLTGQSVFLWRRRDGQTDG